MLTFSTYPYKYSNVRQDGCSIRFHPTEEKLKEVGLALLALTRISSTVLLQLAVWCLKLLLISGALTWSCTERSAAPFPAVTAAVSCVVWAEGDEPEVQEAPALQCSPASSPALKMTTRPAVRALSGLYRTVRSTLANSFFLPSNSLSMKSIRCDTSSWTASMWSRRLFCHCRYCLLSPVSFPPSSLFSAWDHDRPKEAWRHSEKQPFTFQNTSKCNCHSLFRLNKFILLLNRKKKSH